MSISSNTSSARWSEESYPQTFSSTSDDHIEQISPNFKLRNGSDKRCFSKRRKIIIISCITLLILVIITLITTLVILLNSQNKTIETTLITTSNVDSYSEDSIGTITYDVGDGGASGGPPCSSYTVVNDPLRNIATPGIGGKCDNGPLFNTSIGGRWIRFMGTGGTIIPFTSPGHNHCGAFMSGWFNETLPTTVNTMINSSIYFSTQDVTILLETNAAVVNCNNFYVYFLRPVIICNARYCTV